MFTNLIESASHVREFKRRSSFFLITVGAYAVILFAAGVASVYAYDAQLEAQTNSLEVLSWVPPVTRVVPDPPRNQPPVIRRSTPTTAPVDPNITRPERTDFVSRTDDPTRIPPNVGVTGSTTPVITEGAVLSHRNADPPFVPSSDRGCLTCNGTSTAPRVDTETKPPDPPPVKPPATERVTSRVLSSKAVNLPQPAYPAMAKQIRVQGAVAIQILVDEQGKVISAQVVSGNALLTSAARDAAMRARFTPTVLNGQPVKIQGVITYNFVLQ
jgi:protein TonB